MSEPLTRELLDGLKWDEKKLDAMREDFDSMPILDLLVKHGSMEASGLEYPWKPEALEDLHRIWKYVLFERTPRRHRTDKDAHQIKPWRMPTAKERKRLKEKMERDMTRTPRHKYIWEKADVREAWWRSIEALYNKWAYALALKAGTAKPMTQAQVEAEFTAEELAYARHVAAPEDLDPGSLFHLAMYHRESHRYDYLEAQANREYDAMTKVN